jgi:IS30 family transposase
MHEIAEHLGCHYSTISRRLRERERLAGLVRDCKT